MIPKIIHYCWIGNNPLTPLAKKCIDSWHKIMPEYEIKLWNENNYDFQKNEFMRNAYRQKKWGFVPDYARLEILYNYGGLYFDTDVEVLKSFDEFLKYPAFLGFESSNFVNPGSVIGSEKNNKTILDIMNAYNNLPLTLNEQIRKKLPLYSDTITSWEKYPLVTSPVITTSVLIDKYGLEFIDKRQSLKNLEIFPSNYFAPRDKKNNLPIKSVSAYSVHWYIASWKSSSDHMKDKIRKITVLFLGKKISKYLFDTRRFLKKKCPFLFKWL